MGGGRNGLAGIQWFVGGGRLTAGGGKVAGGIYAAPTE